MVAVVTVAVSLVVLMPITTSLLMTPCTITTLPSFGMYPLVLGVRCLGFAMPHSFPQVGFRLKPCCRRKRSQRQPGTPDQEPHAPLTLRHPRIGDGGL
jgi:hypothetical protein